MRPNKGVTQKVVERLPPITRFVLRPVPNIVLASGLEWAFNQSLRNSITAGDLSFMRRRRVAVHILDIDFFFSVTMAENQLKVDMNQTQGDVIFKADLTDLLLLISGKTDPDTLFFHRRLTLSGDTELGLQVKNLLDALDVDTVLPRPFIRLLDKIPAF